MQQCYCKNYIYIWKTDNNNNNILRIKYHKNWVYLNWSLRSWQFSLKLKIQPSTSKRDTGLFPNAKQQIQTQIKLKEKNFKKKNLLIQINKPVKEKNKNV